LSDLVGPEEDGQTPSCFVTHPATITVQNFMLWNKTYALVFREQFSSQRRPGEIFVTYLCSVFLSAFPWICNVNLHDHRNVNTAAVTVSCAGDTRYSLARCWQVPMPGLSVWFYPFWLRPDLVSSNRTTPQPPLRARARARAPDVIVKQNSFYCIVLHRRDRNTNRSEFENISGRFIDLRLLQCALRSGLDCEAG